MAIHESILSRPWLYRVLSDREFGSIFVVRKIADQDSVTAWTDRMSQVAPEPNLQPINSFSCGKTEATRKAPVFKSLCLETTTRCNLRCVHCISNTKNSLGTWDACDLGMGLFQKLMPILREYRPSVQLNGDGETLLHPNFMQMLVEIIGAGCEVMFVTNGMMLTPPSIEGIIQAGVQQLWISIDAASPQLFETIRHGARLAKILENIRLINETKKRLRTQKPQLGFRFTAMRQNIHELPSVVKMAGELEVTYFHIGELVEYNLTRGQSLVNDTLMNEWVSKAKMEAKKWGIKFWLPPQIPEGEVTDSLSSAVTIDPTTPATYRGLQKTCKEPWERVFIRCSGKVQPCCFLDASYGDLSVQRFQEVWFGPKYQELRAALLTDEPPPTCAQCTLYGWEPMDSGKPNAVKGSIADSIESVGGRGVRIANLEAELNRIYNSHGWKALQIYYNVRNKLLPEESRRRNVAKVVWKFFVK